MIDIEVLNKAVEELKAILKEGLIASDFWESSTALSLAGYNSQPAATAMFNQMTAAMTETLEMAGFPKLNRFYLLDMEGDQTVLVIRHPNDVLQGILINNKKANLGVVVAVALPKMLATVAKASV